MKNASGAPESPQQVPLVNEPSAQNLFVLMNHNTYLVANAFGDIEPGAVGLFHHDTRLLSVYQLNVAGHRPSLLSASVSQDNVYFLSHLTNHPLPLLGEETTPQGAIHIFRPAPIRMPAFLGIRLRSDVTLLSRPINLFG